MSEANRMGVAGFSIADLLNSAVVLALLTGGLYFLGWFYWRTYFASFNIPECFIDGDIAKIMSKAWCSLLLILLNVWVFCSSVLEDMDTKENKGPRLLSILFWSQFLLIPYKYNLNAIWYFVVLFLGCISKLPLGWSRRFRRLLEVRMQLSRLKSSLITCLLLFILFCVYLLGSQYFQGKHDARQVIRFRRQRIDLYTMDGTTFTNMVYIGHSSGKYFSFMPQDVDPNIRIVMVDDAVIKWANMYGQPVHTRVSIFSNVFN